MASEHEAAAREIIAECRKWTGRADDAKRIPDMLHDRLPDILAKHFPPPASEQRCPRCNGNGRIEMLEHCPECKGSGTIPAETWELRPEIAPQPSPDGKHVFGPRVNGGPGVRCVNCFRAFREPNDESCEAATPPASEPAGVPISDKEGVTPTTETVGGSTRCHSEKSSRTEAAERVESTATLSVGSSATTTKDSKSSNAGITSGPAPTSLVRRTPSGEGADSADGSNAESEASEPAVDAGRETVNPAAIYDAFTCPNCGGRKTQAPGFLAETDDLVPCDFCSGGGFVNFASILDKFTDLQRRLAAAERCSEPAGERLMTTSAWRFACDWYKPNEIESSIAYSFKQVAVDPVFGGSCPPENVRSREFAVWLCDQYRLAMNKGMQVGNPDDREHIAEWKNATGCQTPRDAKAAIASLQQRLAEANLSEAEQEYRELWCAVWCCPVEEYDRTLQPSEEHGKTHGETKAEAERQAMALSEAERRCGELEKQIEWMATQSSGRNHGASGLCCQLRLQEKERAEKAEARIAALESQRSEWQPISTAPKDGTEFLGCWDNDDIHVVYIRDGECGRAMDDGRAWAMPLFWQPLPQPPEASE